MSFSNVGGVSSSSIMGGRSSYPEKVLTKLEELDKFLNDNNASLSIDRYKSYVIKISTGSGNTSVTGNAFFNGKRVDITIEGYAASVSTGSDFVNIDAPKGFVQVPFKLLQELIDNNRFS